MPSTDVIEPSEDEARAFGRMMVAMDKLKEDRGMMTFSLGMVFLAVASKPGMQVKDYAPMVGLLPSYVSRNLASLGPKERNGTDGMGLIETRAAAANAADTRSKTVVLTPKGEELKARIFKALYPKGLH